LAFSTSLDGLPLASQLWAPNEPGRATVVTEDLQWAEDNETTALGHLLAPLAVRYVVVPVAAGTYGAATDEVVAALDHQVDMVPVGTDPSYRVYVNSSWVPLFSELAANTDLGNRTSAWATAARLQEVDVVPLQAVTVGLSDVGSFALRSHSRSLQLYGAVPAGSWRLQSGGHVLQGRAALGWASSWSLPAGGAAVVLSQAPPTGQHVADLLMVLIWAIALTVALVRVRDRFGAQLTLAGLETGLRSDEVPEIDWESVWDEQHVG
jgi:hypothetical protein